MTTSTTTSADLGIDRTRFTPASEENHASFVTQVGDGRLACVWFAGSREGNQDVCIWLSVLDGADWSDPVVVSADDGRSHQNPVLTVLPDGRWELLYTSQDLTGQASSVVLRQESTDGGRTWGEATSFRAEAGTFIRQPQLVHGSRRLLPIFHCQPRRGEWRGGDDTSAVLVSNDDGRTWVEHPVPDSLGAVHMVVLELDSGWVALYRSRASDQVRRSTSTDGLEWTAPVPTDLPNNNSSITAIRYPTADCADRLLMVANPIGGTAEPPASGAVWGLPRLPLTLLTSVDEGRTWVRLLDLEDERSVADAGVVARNGRRVEMSYPMMLAVDGDVHVTYTWNRETIAHARIAGDRMSELIAGTIGG